MEHCSLRLRCAFFFSGIECMNCNLLIGEEMALKVLKNDAAEEKYRHFLFNDEVKVSIQIFYHQVE